MLILLYRKDGCVATFKPVVLGEKSDLNYERFCFESAGQFISEGEWIHPARTVESAELILVTRGTVFLAEEEREYALTENTLFFLAPRRPHRGTAKSENVSFYWAQFTGWDGSGFPTTLDVGQSARIPLYFRQLIHAASAPGTEPLARDYLLRLILMEAAAPREEQGANPPLLSQMEEHIRLHLDAPLRVADLAELFGYNPDYLSRLFRRAHGVSLKEYIDRARLKRASDLLLTTGLPLSEIAARCGFEDYKYFLRFFSRRQGISPTALRRSFSRTHINHR